MEKDPTDASQTLPQPAQAPPQDGPPPRQRLACVVLIIASLTLAGLLIWATFSRGPLPPQADISLAGGELSGHIEASLYGEPTALFFLEGDPQTKSSGEFDRLLPAVDWEEEDWLRILGIGYGVIWSAADHSAWPEHTARPALAVSTDSNGGFSFSLPADSLPPIESLRSGQTFCAVMLGRDKLLRVDAPFLQQAPIFHAGSNAEAELDLHFTLNFRQDALTGSVSGAEALWPSGIVLVRGDIQAAPMSSDSSATVIDELNLSSDGRTLELAGQQLTVLWSALDPKAWQQKAEMELEATQQHAGVTTYKFLARSDERIIDLRSAHQNSRWVILLENSKAVALNGEIIRTMMGK